MDAVGMVALVPEEATLEAVAFAGPNLADDWQVFLSHLDGTYQVWEDRVDEPRLVHEGRNKDAAIEQYFVSVRKLTMEAMGVAYQPVVDEGAPLTQSEREREGT